MTARHGALLCALLCCLVRAGRADEPGLPAELAGSWLMTKLVCASCSPDGRLPTELAGGAIRIGPARFDDPLAGACPEPSFSTGRQESMTAFLGRTADAAPRLRRLAPADAPVLQVLVTCKPPPHARMPVGAKVTLAYVAPGLLVRPWEDGSFIILKRLASPEGTPTPN